MTTTYCVHAVPAVLQSDNSVSLNPSNYKAPAGNNALLDHRHIPPSRKPPASYHRNANRLRNWYNGRPQLVIIYARYELDMRDFVVYEVHKVDTTDCRRL